MIEKVVIDKMRYYKYIMSLTDKDSHEVLIVPAQGSFTIGIKGVNKDYVDAFVEKDDKINWDALNYISKTSYNILNKDDVSYWPRFISYTGNDTGFAEWSNRRKVEDFIWYPQGNMDINFDKSVINHLYIYSDDYKIKFSIGNGVRQLSLYGNINNFTIKKCGMVPYLCFYPKYDNNINLYRLPIIDCFKDAKELLIEVSPNGAPFDCTSLLQFSNLELLFIKGNITNLESLKELKKLKKIGFWNVPNLSGLPALKNWDNLESFIAVNIDEVVGKKLKTEIASLKKAKKFKFVSVSQLRNHLWFETEYGIPFSNWEGTNKKTAMRAYKSCLNKVKTASNEMDVKTAIIKFISKINNLNDIESVERDDTYDALCLIMKNSNINIPQDKWFKWFDETRTF